MKTVALISGGKDSCYNMMCCIAEGHEIVALANLRPESKGENPKDELDSYMFQTVGHHAIDLYAEAMGLPLYVEIIHGASLSTGRDYVPHQGDEVEDLFVLLSRIKETQAIEAVSVGAILSDYQRVRVENVCQRLGLVCLSFLWRRNQPELLKEMIDSGVKAIIIKVAALGLMPDKHLGVELGDIYPHMVKMRSLYGLNECGEGGEYESFVLDCPIFKKSIIIDETERVLHSDDAFAPVGYLNLRKCHLKDKGVDEEKSLQSLLSDLPMFTSKQWTEDVRGPGTFSEADKSGREDTICSSLSCTSGESHVTSATDGVNFQVSGVTAHEETGSDIKEVTRQAMDLMMERVSALGYSPYDITSVSLYVNDLANFASINSVYISYFNINPPVRLCIQAPLPSSCPLMLDCQGGKGDYHQRRTMHVQALSHWAPANIGPYSQATQIKDKVFLAGIVPLVPATLGVIEGGAGVQCHVALQHVQSVLAAMQSNLTLQCCPMVVCYLTQRCHISIAQDAWGSFTQPSEEDLSSAHHNKPCVQYCVVPALPKGCLVEWHVFAWSQFVEEREGGQEEDRMEAISFTKKCAKWSICTHCVSRKAEQEMFSCHMTLDMVNAPSLSIPLPQSDVMDMVQGLVEQQDQAARETTSAPESSLVKIFFVAGLFDFDYLHACLKQVLANHNDRFPSTQIVSLVPVLTLASPSQVLAWCQ